MAASLIKHKRITTTTAKAKALRTYVEPLITKSKDDTTHSRRVVFSYLQDKDAVSELFREVAGKIAERPGGYTRILKLGNRQGDSAEMAIIELVDYNENLLGGETKGKTTGRRRRGSKKKSDTPQASAGKTETAVIEDANVVEEFKTGEETASAEPEVENAETEAATATEDGSVEEMKAENEAENSGDAEENEENQENDEQKES